MLGISPIDFFGSKIYRYNVYKGKTKVYSCVVTRPPEEVMIDLQNIVFSYDRYDKVRVYCNKKYVGFFTCNAER